jgi:hypothetical protein
VIPAARPSHPEKGRTTVGPDNGDLFFMSANGLGAFGAVPLTDTGPGVGEIQPAYSPMAGSAGTRQAQGHQG